MGDKKPEVTPVGDAGKVVDGNASTDDNGIKWSDGRISMSGSRFADSVNGTDNDDIYVANGAQPKFPGVNGPENIQLGKGRDTVILPGQDGDYQARLPHSSERPSSRNKDFWGNSKFSHGRTIVLENVAKGETYILSDVDRVVFANDKLAAETQNLTEGKLQNPVTPAHMDQMERAVKDGKVTAVSSRELLARAESGMTSQQKIDVRIASTLEAQVAFDKKALGGPNIGGRLTAPEQWDKAEKDVVESMRGKYKDILKQPMELVDVPESTAPVQQQRVAPTIKTLEPS